MMYTIDEARKLDSDDHFSKYRDHFRIEDPELIYLDGNSLGRLPVRSSEIIDNAVNHEWGSRLIRSWNDSWYTKNVLLGDKIAPIAGATRGEVIVTDSTSVNLYKLAHGALKHNNGRKKVVTDELNFPSDIYILQGLVEEFGPEYSLEILKSGDGISVDLDDLDNAIDEDTALVSLSHVAFKSSFRYPMEEVTRLAQSKGAMMLWDLSHSIGAVEVPLNSSNADLAVGCSYKYLNGGPGSPAFLYVRKDLQDKISSPVWGWFAEQHPFEFDLNFRPASGIRKFLSGTPPIISLAAIEPTVDLLNEIGMKAAWQKSVSLSEYFIQLIRHLLEPQGFRLASPEDPARRGSHVSIQHPEAYRICKALIDPEVGEYVVIPDFRDPDNIRIGITPLYTSYSDLFIAVQQLSEIVDKGIYRRFSTDREQVT